MTKVRAGNVEFESIDDYLAAMEAWEEHRAPFKAQAEALADEFIKDLRRQGLSERTTRKHGQNIEIFIVYLTQYTDADDFATVRKGVVNRVLPLAQAQGVGPARPGLAQEHHQKVLPVPGRVEGHL